MICDARNLSWLAVPLPCIRKAIEIRQTTAEGLHHVDSALPETQFVGVNKGRVLQLSFVEEETFPLDVVQLLHFHLSHNVKGQ